MEHESDCDTNCIGKGTGRIENKTTSENHPNYSIIKISQNTEKSTGDLRILSVTQTPVRNRQLKMERKSLKGAK